MPKDFFKVSNMKSLQDIPKQGRIHLIGVSGVAMGQLAVELAKLGYAVSGSDKEFYEPMGSFLRKSKIELKTGYDAANVPGNVDLVVIGNAISYGNPEVNVVEEKLLPYTCFPKILCETIIAGKHSIVVAGTHGKSTTTAMIATILKEAKKEPSYFIGGVVDGFETSLKRGEGTASVVEGDEYDDVFFSKKSKFTHYKPDTFIINAIEYDHADLFPDIESIKKAFISGAVLLPHNGNLLACTDFPIVREIIGTLKSEIKAKIVTFGSEAPCNYQIIKRTQKGFNQTVFIKAPENKEFSFTLPVTGEFNARNALVAMIATQIAGVALEKSSAIVSKFQAVKRRQEVRFDKSGVVLVEDFAHHPTAVKATLAGIREVFPDKTIWAVFEPRSNTSRRKVFENDYISSFGSSDNVILAEVASRSIDQNIELLDVGELAQKIAKNVKSSVMLANEAEVISEHVLKGLSGNDVIVLMSNGSFGGLPAMLQNKLEVQFA